MSLPPLTVPHVLAALSPLLVVLYLMIFRHWGGSKAGPVGYLVAVASAVFVFGADLTLLLVALGRGLLLALFVLYIIWMALLLYHVVNEAGAIAVIGSELPGVARDRASQALLLGWVFGSFLQGASGFGVPAAVVAPLLVGLGFGPNPAVVIALVGHAWAVTFGSLGSSFYSLIAATGELGEILSGPSAGLLAIACLACGAAVLWETGKWAAVRGHWVQLAAVGLIMAGTQFGLAMAGLWSLAAIGAGLAGLIFLFLDLRYSIFNVRSWGERLKRFRHKFTGQHGKVSALPDDYKTDEYSEPDQKLDSRSLIKASLPYAILTIIIILGQLVFKEPLAIINLEPNLPEAEHNKLSSKPISL